MTALIGAVGVAALVGLAVADPTRWSYDGERGPAAWGSLDPAFSACANGTAQSPVDLPAAAPRARTSIDFDYRPSSVTIHNDGHTLRMEYASGSSLLLDNTRYHLVQFHFHHGSEHTVEGVRFPMELHLVHRAKEGRLAVVGVLIQTGAANKTLASIWRHLPTKTGASTVVPGVVDAAALLPATRAAWRYRGSLTTPPCTEGVQWVVMREPIRMSADQVASYGAIYPNSFRPVQPHNGRSVFTAYY